MPKVSVSLTDVQYSYLLKVHPSMSKAIQLVTEDHMEKNGWVYHPGYWEEKNSGHND